MLHLLRVTIIILLTVCNGHAAGHSDQELTRAVMDKANEQAGAMTIPENRYHEEGKEAAEKANTAFRSQEFQEKMKCYEAQVQDLVSGTRQEKPKPKSVVLSESEKLYLFLSSSIPDETVRAYMAILDKTPEITPVMRGMVGGVLGQDKMADWYNRVLIKDPACRDTVDKQCLRYDVPVRINPALFDQYSVTEVPALVYTSDDMLLQVQGDAGLIALLEQVSREARSRGLAGLIDRLARKRDE